MKRHIIKPFFAFLCTAAMLTACYDEENVNIGDTTVQFKETAASISETATSLNVPIEVTGSHHGTVTVTVQCTETNGVEDDKNVIITDRTLRIPVGVSEVNVELRTSLRTETEDPGRFFTLEIVSVEGAALQNSTCRVDVNEMKIVSSIPYEDMIGTWTFSGLDMGYGTVETFDVTIEPDEEGVSFVCTGLGTGNEDIQWPLMYDPDGVYIELGSPFVQANFGDPIGIGLVCFGTLAGSSLSISGNVSAEWVTDTEIAFTSPLIGPIFSAETSEYTGYVMFQWQNCTMTKQ